MSEWDYTSYWRKNFEAHEVAAWGTSIIGSTAVQLLTSMPITTVGVQAGFALAALPKALRVHNAKACLYGAGVHTITLDQMIAMVRANKDDIYFGEAFAWRHMRGQYAFELLALDLEDIITLMLEAGYPPLAIGHALQEVLGQYQRMCIERSNDFSRLRAVLSHVLDHLRKSDAPLPNEQVLEWCTLSNVPSIVTEQLIHG